MTIHLKIYLACNWLVILVYPVLLLLRLGRCWGCIIVVKVGEEEEENENRIIISKVVANHKWDVP
jgi:hypothetical protein